VPAKSRSSVPLSFWAAAQLSSMSFMTAAWPTTSPSWTYRVAAGAARVERVLGTTVRGKRFMDLSYPGGEYGLGVHRGALFSALRGAAERAGVRLQAGVEVVGRSDGALIDAGGCRHGPYDLLVGADGARSTVRRLTGTPARVHEHRWGALWGIFPDPDNVFTALDQYFDGAGRMAGFLPTGTGGVSLFWSVRLDRIEAVRAAGVEAFRADLSDLVPRASFVRIDSMRELLPASYRTVSVPRWHDGRLVLLGDAAHALSPQLGQGANLALMDAAALADAGALDAYEAARRPAARFYAFGARALNLVWQNSFEPAAWPRDHLLGPVSRLPGMRPLMMRTLSGTVFI
jgi:2-polyprenyl-6-methoxyphenol hydroxylase-like FAD-dependent oxidoreductase